MPKYHGIHVGELEQIPCTAKRYQPEIGRIVSQSVTVRPKDADRWRADPGEPIPFVVGQER